jgi:hypothetical protein
LTISLKRSTQNLQLSTSRRPITPSFGELRTLHGARRGCRRSANTGSGAVLFGHFAGNAKKRRVIS